MGNEKEVWFITGASTGFGLDLTRSLLQNGHQVAAVSGDNELGGMAAAGWSKQDLLRLDVDLTIEDSVELAIRQTIYQFGRIDIVVNYGGNDLSAPVDRLSECAIRRHFEENLFGRYHVLKHVMPYLRKQASGIILNYSSPAVSAAIAGSLIYTATKLAIESLSAELTADIQASGIQQTLIGPSLFDRLQRKEQHPVPSVLGLLHPHRMFAF